MNLLPENLEIWHSSLAWQPTPYHLETWQKLYTNILSANQHLNLTRITTPTDFWEKHLWDSLAGICKLSVLPPAKSKVIDIGTGAGFPGLPVAIVYDNWQVFLLDATQKKINFLNNLVKELNLENAQTIWGRAETIAKENPHKNGYDLALVRAVGEVNLCAEYSLSLLKNQGRAILYRGNFSDDEKDKLSTCVENLGGQIEKIETLFTPLTQGVRHCIYLQKNLS